jgi:branched-chain amino acid transport system ATP-binding protein
MLEIRDLVATYGPITALRGVSLRVPEGRIVTILGANGAGKSTTLRAVAGLIRPAGGVIELNGHRIDRAAPESIVKRGIALVPEGRQLFTGLTVDQNLRMGAYTRRDRQAIKRDMEKVYEYFPRLRERASQQAATLSGGEQQMLAIGRALMTRPRLLLLDEPSLGLAPLVVRDIFKIVQAINQEEGTTVVLVEQNAALSLSVADYGYVLETGSVVIEAPGAELQENEAVRKAYLGY